MTPYPFQAKSLILFSFFRFIFRIDCGMSHFFLFDATLFWNLSPSTAPSVASEDLICSSATIPGMLYYENISIYRYRYAHVFVSLLQEVSMLTMGQTLPLIRTSLSFVSHYTRFRVTSMRDTLQLRIRAHRDRLCCERNYVRIGSQFALELAHANVLRFLRR